MRTWPLWIAGTLMGAAIVHILAVLLLPTAIMSTAMGRMAEAISEAGAQAGGEAGVLHTPPPTAASRGVVRPSPDLAYSLCLFDLANGPLLIEASVPDTYWSISAYASNTDNFFVANDTQIPGKRLRLIIAGEDDTEATPAGVPVTFSPSRKGLVLMRMLVTDAASYAAHDAVRRDVRCETLPRAARP